jgi:KDO2-lipid IV(A) lauroyltransferase
MKNIQYQLIKLFHNIFKNTNLKLLLLLSYPIGILYSLISFKNTYMLFQRSKNINKHLKNKYNPILVKINYTKYWLELLWLTKSNFHKSILKNVEIKNENYLKNIKKKGAIFALPHVGNWEMAIPVGNDINLDLLAVAEPLNNELVLSWFKNIREDLGCEIIIGGKGQNTFDTIVKRLQNGKHVCLLSERSINKTGVGTEFFGNLAAFPKGPVALSLKTQLPIVPTAFLKINGKYTLVFEKPFYVPLFENESLSIQQGLKTLSKSFEKLISIDPNQWHSTQPVWSYEY